MKPATLTPAEQAAVRTRIAAGETAREISTSLGIVRKTLLAAVKRHDLGPWKSRGGEQASNFRRDPPADFAVMAAKMSNPQLVKHYGCGSVLPGRWRKELGLGEPPRLKSGPSPRAIPADFKTWAIGKSLRAIAAHYGMSHEMARRFRDEAGIESNPIGRHVAKPVSLVNNAFMAAPLNRPYKEDSRAGFAAETLRRDRWTVFRCDKDGTQNQRGQFWACGRVICNDAELIERAARAERRLAA